MSPALQHFLISASWVLRVAFLCAALYRLWPRRRDFRQRFRKVTPDGIPVERTPDYFDFRSRVVLCLFIAGVLCFVVGSWFRRTFLPPAPPPAIAAEPAPAPSPPRIARSSTARDGDVVKIVCGSGKLCAVTETAQDALKITLGQVPSAKVFYVTNGTKAIITGYDPQDTGSDTADVDILAGADGTSITLSARSAPEKRGYVPGRWMHKLPMKEPVTVYQLQDRGVP